MSKKNDYIKKQVYIMSNLGLFYIIIVAMFAIPLLASFVVVLIKGVVDFRYAIYAGGAIAAALLLFYLVRLAKALRKRVKEDAGKVRREAERNMAGGGQFSISVFNGLFSVSYGGKGGGPPMLPRGEPDKLLLPRETTGASSILSRLKELSDLKKQGIIDESEFNKIKKRLMEQMESESG